jgi:glycosyltransferase involved in cell wall biosynthesis
MPKIALIIPCHDEAARLDRPELLRLARARPDLSILFVDDGSSDGTPEALEALRAEAPQKIRVRRLDANGGKAEAVRDGLGAALDDGAAVVGYLDADLATPVDEMLRLVRALEESGAEVVLGSRVRLLGTAIDRRAARHYVGRLFATCASLALRLPVYDTQCGAKAFRASPALRAALARPFASRWIFDVELLDRLLRGDGGEAPIGPGQLLEVPLRAWRDVRGSKLRLQSMVRGGLDILALLWRSRTRRPARAPGGAPAPGA